MPLRAPKLTLPMCRWRGEPLRETVICHSTKYVDGPHRISLDFCRTCPFPDHNPPPPLPPALPCIHLGIPIPLEEDRFTCHLHGVCVLSGSKEEGDDAARCCGDCGDYLGRDPYGPDSDEMRRRADAFLAHVPCYPRDRYAGRGIVIAGGGDRYFASLYVTVRALRHVGCDLPIEVWYFGARDEMPEARRRLLEPYGVAFMDADRVRARHPTRRWGGWELKVFATLHSRFEEVLFLDSDCYPCRDPGFLFEHDDYRALGAVFWPDMATFDTRLKWAAFHVADPCRPGSVESGQYLVNKRSTWIALNLAWFYNDHSDYYYRYCYGDKHTFEVAWARCAVPFVMWNAQANWTDVAYLHPGSDGAVLFVHRCADKFRLDRHDYVTNQNHPRPRFHPRLPLERECWGWMAELAQQLARPVDAQYFRDVATEGPMPGSPR